MTAELGDWTEMMGDCNRDLAAAHHSAREHAVTLLGFVRELSAATPAPVTTGDEFARLIRLHWRMERRAVENEREVARLRAELADRDRRVGALHDQLVARQAEYDLLRGTRRYRLAVRLAAPLDRWRNGRGH